MKSGAAPPDLRTAAPRRGTCSNSSAHLSYAEHERQSHLDQKPLRRGIGLPDFEQHIIVVDDAKNSRSGTIAIFPVRVSSLAKDGLASRPRLLL